MHYVDRFFCISERRSTLRTEVIGGLTTFAAMAYIIVVNPAILEHAGIPKGPSTVATILAVVFGTLLMGLYANRPLAVAPYMGENAFIAFSLTGAALGLEHGVEVTWQQRLGTVFVAGAVFFVLTIFNIRTWLARAISPSMKRSFGVGIGLFLLFVGLNISGIIVGNKIDNAPPVKLGPIGDTKVLLAIGGFLFITILMHWKVRGAILLGVVLTALTGLALGEGKAPAAVFALPWDEEYHLGKIALQLDIAGVLRWSFFPILLTLVLISFLDTLGTLVAVGSAGETLDDKGDSPPAVSPGEKVEGEGDLHKPMIVDSLACMFSALVGTSTSGAYIESATGIREGARTGLAAVVIALLFAVCLFFIPLVQPLQELGFAYAPALMAVGLLMFANARHIDFDDLTETVPSLATIAIMVFSYNIANGLTAGLILYPLFKLAAGRWRELHPAAVVLGFACLIYYVFGVPH